MGLIFAGDTQQGTRIPPYVNLPRSSKSRNPHLGSPTKRSTRCIPAQKLGAMVRKKNKKNFSKEQRVVIVDVNSEARFESNALCIRLAQNQATIMITCNYMNYEKWLRTQLMPSLFANSGVVVNNAFYYNTIQDHARTSNSRKCDMESCFPEKEYLLVQRC
ncbi:hypothetical protein EVAR_56799_1 [Eumeta japonica]|uniref:Uncharacterized protein n=1 Tax=Eumeta variegata TaxID=151549 RepID=A0A4C1Y4D0_EUMVA|nr:hypothetical protein EVAR_56799_1 [Eumeta japonica]